MGPAPNVMVRVVTEYRTSVSLAQIDDNLNADWYISDNSHPVVVYYLQGLPKAILHQDNVIQLVARRVLTFFDT